MIVTILTIHPNIDNVDLLNEQDENDPQNITFRIPGYRISAMQLFAKQFFKR